MKQIVPNQELLILAPPEFDASKPFRIASDFEPAGDQLADFINEQREFRKSSPRRKPGPILPPAEWLPAGVYPPRRRGAGMTPEVKWI